MSDERYLVLVSGAVNEEVARLDLTVEGETERVALQGRFFLAELELPDGGRQPDPEIPNVQLRAYDAAGQELVREKSAPPFRGSGAGRRPQPIDLSGETPLLQITTRKTGKPIKLYVLERNGERCTVLVSPGGTGTGCGSLTLKPNEIAVTPNQIGSAPRGMLLLWGEVGSEISQLELRFEDGRIEQLPLAKQFTLYQVDPKDFASGRRPVELISRNAIGGVVSKRPLGPWQP